MRPGDWVSVARGLEELISAHSGEDSFIEARKLLIAKLVTERFGADPGDSTQAPTNQAPTTQDSCAAGRPKAPPLQPLPARKRGLSALERAQRAYGLRPGTTLSTLSAPPSTASAPPAAPVKKSDEGVAIDRLLARAEARWPGLLGADATTRLDAVTLRRCERLLHSVPLLDAGLVGLDTIFEVMVTQAAKGQKGQYFTPRHVIAELVAMVDLQPGERVLDPACGSGGFLHHALRAQPGCEVWGMDQDPRACGIARVMLAASGEPIERVLRGDSLRRPSSTEGPSLEQRVRAESPGFQGFDVILTNPPFAGDVSAAHASAYELARGRRVERDVLFLERCLELLKPGGRLAMVLPHNKVGGERWAFLRSWLLARLQVVAAVGLGRNTFQPHTSQKAVVLLGVKRPALTTAEAAAAEQILFFISERDGKDRKGRLHYAADGETVLHDLGEATPLVRARFGAWS